MSRPGFTRSSLSNFFIAFMPLRYSARIVLSGREEMTFSERILGKKNVNGKPHIESVVPSAALPGGEVRIIGSGLKPPELNRPVVEFGDVEAAIVVSSDNFLVAKVPDGVDSASVIVRTNGHESNPSE